jgi:hypothetical protein
MAVLMLWARLFRDENMVLADETLSPREHEFHYERRWFSPFGSPIYWG